MSACWLSSGIILLSKTLTKYQEFFPTLFVKTTDFLLVFNSEQTRTVTRLLSDFLKSRGPFYGKNPLKMGNYTIFIGVRKS